MRYRTLVETRRFLASALWPQARLPSEDPYALSEAPEGSAVGAIATAFAAYLGRPQLQLPHTWPDFIARAQALAQEHANVAVGSPAPVVDAGGWSPFVDRERTLVDILQLRGRTQGPRVGFSWLSSNGKVAGQRTYGELDISARAIAATLQARSKPGDRALLLYEGGLPFVSAFFGCLYAKTIAVPAYPPNPFRLQRSLERLMGIVRDARPTMILTTKAIITLRDSMGIDLGEEFASVEWIATDAVDDQLSDQWSETKTAASDIAMLQYTSGSTGAPKGVMVSHGNLLYNEEMIHQSFETHPGSVVVGWLPLFHDMGLIGNVLQPVYTGFHSVLMSPLDFLQHPGRWLRALSEFEATIGGGPNFAYELCLRKIGDDEVAGLNLANWNVAFNGAEPIFGDTLDRFAARFERCGFSRRAFYPCYGLAEATLILTGSGKNTEPVVLDVQAEALGHGRAVPASDGDTVRMVGSGRQLFAQDFTIVDPDTGKLCGEGQVGEIWAAGPAIAGGYYGNETATVASFGVQTTGSDPTSTSYLRTGDLAFVWKDDLFVTGRIKDLMIIRGRNYYPHEVERTIAASSKSLRAGSTACFTVRHEGQFEPVAVQELAKGADPDAHREIFASIREAVVREHGLRLHDVLLIPTGTIPKTSSGKLRRRKSMNIYLARLREESGAASGILMRARSTEASQQD